MVWNRMEGPRTHAPKKNHSKGSEGWLLMGLLKYNLLMSDKNMLVQQAPDLLRVFLGVLRGMMSGLSSWKTKDHNERVRKK